MVNDFIFGAHDIASRVDTRRKEPGCRSIAADDLVVACAIDDNVKTVANCDLVIQ